MRQVVIGLLTAAFLAGAASPAMSESGAAQLQQGKELFISKAVPACAVCHTLADAGSVGAIGPDLDEIKPDVAAVKRALREGLGVMPNFSQTLSEDEIEAVAAYVAHAVGH